MHITLLSVGKTKLQPIAALEEEYGKRITGRFSFSTKYLRSEKELILEVKNTSAYVIALDENGSTMNSHEFAQYIDKITQSYQEVIFVIGDTEGLPAELREYTKDILALSEMTFTHEFARAIFIEQLYRAKTIIEGHPYHK